CAIDCDRRRCTRRHETGCLWFALGRIGRGETRGERRQGSAGQGLPGRGGAVCSVGLAPLLEPGCGVLGEGCPLAARTAMMTITKPRTPAPVQRMTCMGVTALSLGRPQRTCS